MKLQELEDQEPVFDLVIMDEAHHLRNPSTQSHKLAELIRSVSEHAVFLSATPIHLKIEIFCQLKLLDPGAFVNESDFEALIEANNPVIAARELVLHQGILEERKRKYRRGIANALLSDSNNLKKINEQLAGAGTGIIFR